MLNKRTAYILALATIAFVSLSFLFVTKAHEDSDDYEDDYDDNEGRWILECPEVAHTSGCWRGGFLYHSKHGPDADIFYVHLDSSSGQPTAVRVELN